MSDLKGSVAEQLKQLDPQWVQEQLAKGPLHLKVNGRSVFIEPEDVEIVLQGQPGFSVLMENGSFVALDKTITPELEREGLMRDFVRHVQNLRKERGLDIADRISVQYAANADVQQALIEWVEYIKNETLAIDFIAVPQLAVPPAIEIKIGGNKIYVDLR